MSSVDSAQGRLDLAQGSCATEPPSKSRKLTPTASIATEHASPAGTATEHASASASTKGSTSADDMPLETVSQEPDSSGSTKLPVTLRCLAAVVKKHADNYEPEFGDIYFAGEPFLLKDIRDEYKQQQQSCDEGILYACIHALLVVYHVDKLEHTTVWTECVLKRNSRKADIYNMFHTDATASVDQFACKIKLSRGYAISLLTAGLYAELHPMPSLMTEPPASPKTPQHVQRAERYLHRLGECLHATC